MLTTVNVVYGNVFYIVRIAKLAWLQLLAFLGSTWGAIGAVETAGVMAEPSILQPKLAIFRASSLVRDHPQLL